MCKTIILAFLVLTSCSGQDPDQKPAVPDSCYLHDAADFNYGTFKCDPQTADTCAFGAHNTPVPLDSSGDPLAYYCTCSGDHYSCWGVSWFVKADPLPKP